MRGDPRFQGTSSCKALWATIKTLAFTLHEVGRHWGVLNRRKILYDLSFIKFILAAML